MKRCAHCNRPILFPFPKRNGLCFFCWQKALFVAREKSAELRERFQLIRANTAAPQSRLSQLMELAAEIESATASYNDTPNVLEASNVDLKQLHHAVEEEIALAQKELSFIVQGGPKSEDFAARLKRELALALQKNTEAVLKNVPIDPEHTPTVFDVRYRRLGSEIRSGDLQFISDDFSHVMLDGARRVLDVDDLREAGYTADGRFKKLIAYDLTIWITPGQFREFMGNVLYCREQLEKQRRQQWETDKAIAEMPVQFDPPDDSLWKCFFANPPRPTDEVFYEPYQKLFQAVSLLCASHGGRCYKTAAKSANFAVIVGARAHNAAVVNELQEKGYKVCSVADAVNFWKLENIWENQMLENALAEYHHLYTLPYETYRDILKAQENAIRRAVDGEILENTEEPGADSEYENQPSAETAAASTA